MIQTANRLTQSRVVSGLPSINYHQGVTFQICEFGQLKILRMETGHLCLKKPSIHLIFSRIQIHSYPGQLGGSVGYRLCVSLKVPVRISPMLPTSYPQAFSLVVPQVQFLPVKF